MTQTYSGGALTSTTGNPSCYITHGGTDMGFLAPEVQINLSPSFEPLHFAQAKGAYGNRTIEGDRPMVSGEMKQLTQALVLLLHPDGGSLDSGNAIGHDGQYGTVITGAEAWTYFLHAVSGLPKRLKFPLADLVQAGEWNVGGGADDFSLPFNLLANIDPDGTSGEKLWRLYFNEDDTDITVTPSPADAATGVSVSATVTLTFSEAVGANYRVTTADNPYIFIFKDDGTEAASSISWNSAGTVATIAHSDFTSSTDYHIVVSGDIRGANGRKISGDGSTTGSKQVVNFTTA